MTATLIFIIATFFNVDTTQGLNNNDRNSFTNPSPIIIIDTEVIREEF